MTKEQSNSTSRRTFLKRTAGVATAASALSTLPSSAVAADDSQGTDDAGITDAVRNLTTQGKLEEAKKLLNKHDVEHDHDQLQAVVGDGSSDGVSTQEVFNDEKSTFDLFGYAVSKPIYNVELHWDLHPRYPESDCPDPNDGNGISFSDSRWAFEPGSEFLSEHTKDFSVEPQGTKAKWDDSEAYVGEGDTQGFQIVGLEKQTSGAHNIYGHYIHTFQNLCGVAGVAFSISYKYFGIASSSGGVSSWEVGYPDVPIIEI